EAVRGGDLRARVEALWGLTRDGDTTAAKDALADADPAVRAEAVRLLGRDGESMLKDPDGAVRRAALLQVRSDWALPEAAAPLESPAPFLVSAALTTLGRKEHLELLRSEMKSENARRRLGVVLALRATGEAEARAALPDFLDDADPEVRRAAIQWVGE